MEEGLLLPVVKEDNNKNEKAKENVIVEWRVIGEEVKRVSYIGGPMVAVVLSQYLLQVVSQMMVGHLGELYLSSTAIAVSLSTVTGYSLLDDILPKLMTYNGSYEDLFKKEISKYDHICEEIAQNLEAQEQLLVQIKAQNDQFAALFNLEDYKASQERCFKQIEAAVAKYREIKDNINEGLKFYVTLQDAITNVKQQCSDYVMTRNIQCREMIKEVQRKVSGLSLQDRENPSNHSYPSVGSGQSNYPPRTMSQHQPDAGNDPRPPHQSYYQPPQNSSVPGYGPPPYGSAPQRPHVPPYQPPPSAGAPYPPQQPPPQHPQRPPPQHQQPPAGHECGQPAYPGWQGPYYNAHSQQPGSFPRPPYSAPGSYPPHQSGYYRPQ